MNTQVLVGGVPTCWRCRNAGVVTVGDHVLTCRCQRTADNDEISAEELSVRAAIVREAQRDILDAIARIEQAIEGHPYEDNWDAYVVAHLTILATDEHGYLSRGTTLDDVIRKLEGREDEEDW